MSDTDNNTRTLDDGFGNCWHKCSRPGGCMLQIVRPGAVQCACQYDDAIESYYQERVEDLSAQLKDAYAQLDEA